jgi:hypothetical protein
MADRRFIFVRNWNEGWMGEPPLGFILKIREFNFTDTTTVFDLKWYICREEEETDVDKIRVIFAGKQLENDKLLIDYNLKHESTLTFIKKLS